MLGRRETVLAALAALALFPAGCRGQTKTPAASPTPSSTPTAAPVVASGNVNPEAAPGLKRLMFADDPDEYLPDPDDVEIDAGQEPWRSFAEAAAARGGGRREEAKRALRRILSLPGTETRILLAAWKGLRDLGEPPPANASQVQGVVCELHNYGGISTLAAYADGRARWLGGQHNFIAWEGTGEDAEVRALVNDLLKAAAPLVRRAPAVDTHRAEELGRERFRASVLTFGGIHVVEIYGPDVDHGARFMEPTLSTSTELLKALLARAEMFHQEVGPTPP